MNFFNLVIFWKTYIPINVILKTKQVIPVQKIELITAALDLKAKTYIMHMAKFIIFNLLIYIFLQALVRVLQSVNIPMTISNKYSGFANIFLLDLAIQLLKYIRIHNYVIKGIDN